MQPLFNVIHRNAVYTRWLELMMFWAALFIHVKTLSDLFRTFT